VSAKVSKTCCRSIMDILAMNSTQNFTTDEMRKALWSTFRMIYARATTSLALRQLYIDGKANRVRTGNQQYRYSIKEG